MKRVNATCGLLGALALLVLTGCTSSGRYQVNIGNGHEHLEVVRDVRVSMDGSSLKEFPVIAPQKIAATRPQSGNLPEVITLEWTSPEGETHQGDVKVADVVPEDFKGQLVVQINPDHSLTLMQDPSRSKDLSPIPWNAPEAWEGSVMIPGFNQ